tara:strand:- start:96 stop:344 length:249 start_codon:yes stop_codon:yes gene_type:complete
MSESEMAQWMYENTIDYWCGRLQDWQIQQMEELFKQCSNIDLDWRSYLISGTDNEDFTEFIMTMPDDDVRKLVKMYDADRKK